PIEAEAKSDRGERLEMDLYGCILYGEAAMALLPLLFTRLARIATPTPARLPSRVGAKRQPVLYGTRQAACRPIILPPAQSASVPAAPASRRCSSSASRSSPRSPTRLGPRTPRRSPDCTAHIPVFPAEPRSARRGPRPGTAGRTASRWASLQLLST